MAKSSSTIWDSPKTEHVPSDPATEMPHPAAPPPEAASTSSPTTSSAKPTGESAPEPSATPTSDDPEARARQAEPLARLALRVTLALTRRADTTPSEGEVHDVAAPLGEILPGWALHPVARLCLALVGPVLRRPAAPPPRPPQARPVGRVVNATAPLESNQPASPSPAPVPQPATP